MPPKPGIRVVTGPSWWTPARALEQSQLDGLELVQIKNGFWTPDQDPEGEYYFKYECLLKDGKRVIIPNRVSDISGVKWDINPLMDWASMEALNRLIGEPYCEDANGNRQRGGWRTLSPLIRDGWKLRLDDSQARLSAFESYAHVELLELHRRAWQERNQKRDEAAELGTRAHELIDLWLKNFLRQNISAEGVTLIDEIYYADKEENEFFIPLEKERPEVQSAVRAFHRFYSKYNLLAVESEKLVCDLTIGVAGQVDNVSRTADGRLVVIDYKTGNYIGQSALLQVAGYSDMLATCFGMDVAMAYIVQLDKFSADFRLYPVFEDADSKAKLTKSWKLAVELYHWQKAAGKQLANYR